MHRDESPEVEDNHDISVACELSESDQKARSEELRHGLFADCHRLAELPDGFALCFGWHPERLRVLGDFLAFESDCCPFLRLTVEVAPGRSEVWLGIRASPEAKRAIEGDLLPLLPDGVSRGRDANCFG